MRIDLPDNISAERLAAECGCSYANIRRAISSFDPATGIHVCGPGLAAKIHWATGGRVAAWILRPDIWANGQVPPNPFHSIPLAS